MKPYTLVSVLFISVVLLAGCGATAPRGQTATEQASQTEPRTELDTPREITDFEMPSNTGESVKLSDLRGKPVLLFFGYTQCPDYCPATLGDFKQIKQDLGDQGDDVAYVFISVDGERDTPDVLDSYVRNFDPSFIGLQGTSETLQPIAKDFGLYAKKNTDTQTAAGYLVDHTVATYLIDQEGRLRVIYPFEATPDLIARDVEALLDGQL